MTWRCRTAALGGHTEQCGGCGTPRSRTTRAATGTVPSARRVTRAAWLEREAADLLPVDYYHVVFTLPAALARWPCRTRAVLYDLLLRTAGETVRELAADPHTWERRSACWRCCTPGVRR